MEKDEATQQPELAQSREPTKQTQAESELSDEQIDRVVGGVSFVIKMNKPSPG